jgi:hypothetical protein
MKILRQKLSSRLEQIEDRISELEDKVDIIEKSDKHKKE